MLQVSNSPDDKKSSRALADITSCQVDKHGRTQTVNTTETFTPCTHPRSEVLGDRTWGESKVGLKCLTRTAINEDKTVRKSVAAMNVYGLPITSTAKCEGRAVRRSTRLSTRLSFQAALANDLSPCENMISFMSHENGNVTVLNSNKSPSSYAQLPTFLEDTTVSYSETDNGSPVLRPFLEKKTGTSLEVTKIEKRECVEEFESVDDVKEELSTDAALMKGACALPTSDKIGHTAVANLATHSVSQELKKCVVQLESNKTSLLLGESLQTEKHDVNRKRRRSCRVSAQNATLLNHQILHNESPILRSRRRSTADLNKTRGEVRLLLNSLTRAESVTCNH